MKKAGKAKRTTVKASRKSARSAGERQVEAKPDRATAASLTEDQMAIEQLLHRYCHVVDRGTVDEIVELFHRDTYYMARRLLAISSRRLANVCNHLFGETNKTRIDSRHWILALQGDKDALDYIVDHCRKDVIDLQRVYQRLEVYTKDTDRSI